MRYDLRANLYHASHGPPPRFAADTGGVKPAYDEPEK